MRKKHEGIRRLSILVGFLGCFAWIVFIFIISEGFANMDRVGWFVFLLGALVIHFILWFLVRGTYRIYVVFKPEPRDK